MYHKSGVEILLLLLTQVSPGSCQKHIVHVPATGPIETIQPVDLSFTGFAFEQASFYNYSFAAGKPNEFSQNLINSVLSHTGGTPILRVGGTSGDHGRYDATQGNATNYPATIYKPRTDVSEDRLSLGPPFFEAFNNWPGAKFEFMVPFYDTDFSHSVQWAKAGVNRIGMNNLYALEIGNEPNFYPWFSVDEYVRRYGQLQKRLIAAIPSLSDKRVFQVFDAAANFADELTSKKAFEAGLNKNATTIKQAAYHYYQGHGISLDGLQDWIRHTTTMHNLTKFTPNIGYLNNNHPAIGFAFTETGYNVGNGGGEGAIKPNNLATALWAVDFQLAAMTVGVRRVNWQQILRSSLNMWIPVKSTFSDPRVTANFYSQPFVADLIGKSGETRVMQLDVGSPDKGLYVAYAAYDAGKLSRIALLNLEIWHSGEGDNRARPQISFSLQGLPGRISQATVHHLTAEKGALAKNNLTYAGFEWTYESRGKQSKVKSDSKILAVSGGEVDVVVKATQAVLVELA
ncbi:hypothetical protein GGR57DRAFT_511654 [Xylariaceae sp. FL1272]|nr:hypothetical protein GGR57DRAFT_511654 [Xylariaceae sp. FL1272]